MTPVLTNELVSTVEQLPEDKQRAVLEYARGLSKELTDRNARLRDLFGSISPEDGETMLRVIEEECERIDAESW